MSITDQHFSLSFTHKLYLFLSIHRAQQPRTVGKALTIGREISPTPPLISKGWGSESAKFGVVCNSTQIWATRVWKWSKISEIWNRSAMLRWSPYVLAKFGEVGFTRTPKKALSVLPPRPKIARGNRAKSITQQSIIPFRWNFVQS